MPDQILLERHGDGIAELVLNRPEKHNAISPEMAAAIRDARRQINDDDEIRAVVVRGAGERAFCAGTDIAQLDSFKDAWAFRNRICYATEFRRIKKPTVAALKGWAVGGGLEIAINCDIRIAAPSTKIGAPEVKHGWLGGGGQTQMLTRLVGYGKAMMMCLTGDTYGSDEAYRMGVIEQMVGEGEEVAAARDMAARIAGHTTIATMTVKEGIRAALNGTLDGASRYENDLMVLAFALGNQRKGIDEFVGRKDA
ncbi:enoyl-CoA hydratase [Devosia sp. UYZn731]|uniref:enoyl-CoA hydratase/isomerase family protein n=1 Tax=Devosia sp. UYZn731 TaxID=3156345 RepID=UPI00339A2DEE